MGGGDYLLALKGNQGTLHRRAIDYVTTTRRTSARLVLVVWIHGKRNMVGSRGEPIFKCPSQKLAGIR